MRTLEKKSYFWRKKKWIFNEKCFFRETHSSVFGGKVDIFESSHFERLEIS